MTVTHLSSLCVCVSLSLSFSHPLTHPLASVFLFAAPLVVSAVQATPPTVGMDRTGDSHTPAATPKLQQRLNTDRWVSEYFSWCQFGVHPSLARASLRGMGNGVFIIYDGRQPDW